MGEIEAGERRQEVTRPKESTVDFVASPLYSPHVLSINLCLIRDIDETRYDWKRKQLTSVEIIARHCIKAWRVA